MFVQQRPTNGAAVAALVLGIIAFAIGVWSVVPFLGLVAAFLAFLPAILGAAFGHRGMRDARVSGVGRDAAMWGTFLSYATLAVMLFVAVWWMIGMATTSA